MLSATVNTHEKEPLILGFRLITVLFSGCLVRDQPESVLNESVQKICFRNAVDHTLPYRD